MFELNEMIKGRDDCPCGKKHKTAIRDIRCGKGLVHQAGSILKENGFSKELLLVSDKNCIKAAEGILESLSGFELSMKLYGDLRVATMEKVEEIETLLDGKDMDVISVGSGSLNDICRLACARKDRNLCLFATAPSMDGFASDSAPIVAGGFKSSYPARSPQVIIADTEILAKAPARLKSAGFGDMMAKYVGLVDWQISALVSGEYYCPYVGEITRYATDSLFAMADRVTADDPETAGQIFKSLILTGIGMSYTGNSRPASGAEHIVAHLIDCFEIGEGKLPNLHGEDVGVATIDVLRYYNELAKRESISTHPENVDWNKVFEVYGPLAGDVKRLNTPDTILSSIDPEKLRESWPGICEIIRSVPSADAVREAMEKAGCMITTEDSGKTSEFYEKCFKYSPYMRRRITLLRLMDMIDLL